VQITVAMVIGAKNSPILREKLVGVKAVTRKSCQNVSVVKSIDIVYGVGNPAKIFDGVQGPPGPLRVAASLFQ
jgi:hypothetical protein